MLPVDEGNDECRKCDYFDLGMGCASTYEEHGLPPCGRNIIISQEVYKKLIERKRSKWQLVKRIYQKWMKS